MSKRRNGEPASPETTKGVTPREAILDAAEACFAEHGFDGTSVRSIGLRAKINPALVHYYFDSKETLYNEVFARRAGAINRERREKLLTLFAEAAPGLPRLEQVLDAIIRPTVELGRDDRRGGRHYTTLVNNIASAIDARSLKLISENYDPIARLSNSGRSATSVVPPSMGSCRAISTPSLVATRSGSMKSAPISIASA